MKGQAPGPRADVQHGPTGEWLLGQPRDQRGREPGGALAASGGAPASLRGVSSHARASKREYILRGESVPMPDGVAPSDPASESAAPRGAAGEVARLFLKLGVIGFGGPAAHIALMEDEVVRRRRWLTREQFLDLLGATNLI